MIIENYQSTLDLLASAAAEFNAETDALTEELRTIAGAVDKALLGLDLEDQAALGESGLQFDETKNRDSSTERRYFMTGTYLAVSRGRLEIQEKRWNCDEHGETAGDGDVTVERRWSLVSAQRELRGLAADRIPTFLQLLHAEVEQRTQAMRARQSKEFASRKTSTTPLIDSIAKGVLGPQTDEEPGRANVANELRKAAAKRAR